MLRIQSQAKWAMFYLVCFFGVSSDPARILMGPDRQADWAAITAAFFLVLSVQILIGTVGVVRQRLQNQAP